MSLRQLSGLHIVVVLFFLLHFNVSAYLGGRADAYFRSSVGAAALAMGNAGAAAPTSFLSLWNPATLTAGELSVKRLAAGSALRSMGRVDACASLEFRIPTRVGVGVGVLYRGDPAIDIYDPDEYRIGSAGFTTLSAKLGIGLLCTRDLSVGAALGLSHQSLPANFYSLEDRAWTFSIGLLDIGVRYRLNDRWVLAAVMQNLNAVTDWQFASYSAGGLNQSSSPALPAAITVASERWFVLTMRPLRWVCDLRFYAINATLQKLDHPSVVINNGFEWQRWESFFLRWGLSDLTFDGEILRNSRAYADRFWLGVHAGFHADASRIVKGLAINYGISLAKYWSGIDQYVDVVYTF